MARRKVGPHKPGPHELGRHQHLTDRELLILLLLGLEGIVAALDALKSEVARTVAIDQAILAKLSDTVPAADVQGQADALKAANDSVGSTLNPPL